ncbi:MAG: exodeoxyribonuclease V subunit beta [Verrucomicrobiota bacterium]
MSAMQPFDVVHVPLEKGTTLIEASAGTGKTYSIAALFLRLVLEERAPVQSILAVTYTTAATQELRERVRARLHAALVELKSGAAKDEIAAKYLAENTDPAPGIGALELAVQSFDEARIFTIHGFCQRLLQEHAFESGARYGAQLLTDSKPLLEEVAHDFWRGRMCTAPGLLAALALTHGASPDDWVELLQQSRNHPDLRIFPEPGARSCEAIAAQLEAAFVALRLEWKQSAMALEALLNCDKNLKPSERKWRIELLEVLRRLDGDEPPDKELMEALDAFSAPSMEAATGKNKTTPTHAFFGLCETLRALAETYFDQLTHALIAYAAAELPARKLHLNVWTYDDLLTLVHAALLGANGDFLARAVGAKYRAALIDEFQDTDPLQYAIFQRLFGHGAHWLFFIGDPKQAIYGFRGADVFTYLQAARSAARQYTLETNWRSDQALLNGFNPFFMQRGEATFVVESIQYHPVHSPNPEIPPAQTPPLQFRYLPCGEEKELNQETAMRRMSDAAAADIARLHVSGGGDWQWSDLAVLARTHRQAAAVQAALRRRGIRSVLHTEESVFHSQEAVELARVLEATLTPGNNARLHAALTTPLLALNGNDIARLTPEAHQQWVERFAVWRSLWRDAGFAAMFRALLAGHDLRRRVMEQPGGERRLTNVLHLAELLHEAEAAQRFTPEALLEWLGEQRAAQRSAPDAAQLRLESDGDAVQVVTVHKSKGLEYNVVLCPFLWSPADTPRRDRVQFHDDEGRLTLDLRGKRGAAPEAVAQHGVESLGEEVRLLYVAVTRARHRCFIYAGDIQKPGPSALGHLLGEDIPGAMKAIADAHPESIACTFIDAEEPIRLAAQAEAASSSNLVARTFPGAIHTPAFLTSFTGLTAGTSREEPERDQPLEPTIPDELKPIESDGIFLFEKGARAGEFFHDVLEHLDFQNPRQLDSLVPAKLAAHGFAGTPHTAALKRKLAELLDVELAPGLRLRNIPIAERLAEVEFSTRLPLLRPEDLRALFSSHANPALDPEALGALRFSPVEGFLRGFIDLLFRHEGRYYIVDWKSNWLGNRPEDYDSANIAAAMRAHHYALQAHLYVLAVDRFLAARLPDYHYETHFGGVFYLFLRGVDAANPERGVFRCRPALALVEKLRALSRD